MAHLWTVSFAKVKWSIAMTMKINKLFSETSVLLTQSAFQSKQRRKMPFPFLRELLDSTSERLRYSRKSPTFTDLTFCSDELHRGYVLFIFAPLCSSSVLQMPHHWQQSIALRGDAVTAFYSLLKYMKNGGYVKSLPSLKCVTKDFLSLLHLNLSGCVGWYFKCCAVTFIEKWKACYINTGSKSLFYYNLWQKSVTECT